MRDFSFFKHKILDKRLLTSYYELRFMLSIVANI